MSTSASPASAAAQHRLIALVMCLFFAFGFCTVLVDTLVPKLKGLFSLSYTEVMLTQFCFFGAYLVVSIPASAVVARIGYLQTVVIGLGLMATGCLLFTPAAAAGVYPGFLGALFVLASGVTMVQVAANPLAVSAGDPAKAHSRLTLAQAFNSLATTVGPFFGAMLILSDQAPPDPARLTPAALAIARTAEAQAVKMPFQLIAAVVLVLAAVCWIVRRWSPPVTGTGPSATTGVAHLYRRPRLMLGALSIFLYVGAEVSIGSALASFLMQPSTLHLATRAAGTMVAYYWGLAMVGRFIGSYALRVGNPALILSAAACGAGLLATTAGVSAGTVAGYALIAVGFCNSIMFPTIFALATEGLSVEDEPKASGIISASIFGGAVVPVLTGFVADHASLAVALAVPVVCYVWIAVYGLLTRESAVVSPG